MGGKDHDGADDSAGRFRRPILTTGRIVTNIAIQTTIRPKPGRIRVVSRSCEIVVCVFWSIRLLKSTGTIVADGA